MIAQRTLTEQERQASEHNKGVHIEDGSWISSFICQKLIALGTQKRWAEHLKNKIIREWNASSLSEKEKVKWLRRGFLPNTTQLYGLTDENYTRYLSDVDYLRIHPINNHFAFWINDKITLKYIFANPICIDPAQDEWVNVMPEYYLYIENDGHYTYLMNCPDDIARNEEFLINLLVQKHDLALKPSNGGGGKGFIRLSYRNHAILWNEEVIDRETLAARHDELNGYIVTEYIRQHPDFDPVWDKSVSTLRIITVRNNDNPFGGGNVDVISSYVRFGTVCSEGACNMHTGGVAIHYDFDSGKFGNFFFRYPGFGKTHYDSHPDSGTSLRGKTLPMWENVRKVVLAVANYLSSLDYLGIDIVITPSSVILLEINSLPAISSPQSLEGPIFDNPQAAKFFNRKLLLKNKSLVK